MKIRWKNRPGRIFCSLLTLALAAGTAAAVPVLNGTAAEFIDLAQPCSVRIEPVDPQKTEFSEDLKSADIVYDIYMIAEAEEVPGYDTYTYKFVSNEFGDYAELQNLYHEDFDEEAWERLAQEAATLTLKDSTAPPPVIAEDVTNSEIMNLPCGLYLIIARGRNIEDYYERVTDEEGNVSLVSVAYSDEHIYRFKPTLVSLPGKMPVPGGSTSEADSWHYDLTVTLKPEQEPRYGQLRIVKTLLSYETRDPATFVFEITATIPDRRDSTVVHTVYSDVVTLTFTEPGEQFVLLEKKLPVGATVVVKEVYSGAVYTPVTTVEPDPVIIPALPDVAEVRFTNDYNEDNRSGGSITNHFVYDEENTWVPEQIYDDSRVSEGGQR